MLQTKPQQKWARKSVARSLYSLGARAGGDRGGDAPPPLPRGSPPPMGRAGRASSSSSLTKRPVAAACITAVGGDRPLSDFDHSPRPDALANRATALLHLALELPYPCIRQCGCGLQPTNAFALAFHHIHEPPYRESPATPRICSYRASSVSRELGQTIPSSSSWTLPLPVPSVSPPPSGGEPPPPVAQAWSSPLAKTWPAPRAATPSPRPMPLSSAALAPSRFAALTEGGGLAGKSPA
eukprot:scaffold12397_cov68-Phaeocystis_antarctica.AAC.3